MLGQTPLHCACAGGNLDIARILVLEFNDDLSTQDNTGRDSSAFCLCWRAFGCCYIF